MANAAEPLVAPHCVRCAYGEAPVVCTRCEANEYCSAIHQKDDTQRHRKGQCRAVLEAREALRATEAALRSSPADGIFLPADVFNEGVGDFYAIHETRPYMEAKRALIVELANVGSHSGYLKALEEASDALRLDEQDHLELRQPVPALLILMGRFQDAYDFIRFWATCEDEEAQEEDDDVMEDTSVAPCFRNHGAPMTESLDVFKNSSTVPVLHLCALTFLKLMVKFGIQGAIEKLRSNDQSARQDALEFLEDNGLPASEDELTALAKDMERQAIEACFMVQDRDKMVWWPIYMPKMINAEVHRWLTAYADMYHWFPPALEAVYNYGTKTELEAALAAFHQP